jgi:hypothetical protein
MLEGLWTIEFVSNVETYGAGVVVFESGRILGGDSSYNYLGTFRVKNEIVEADVEGTHHSGQAHSIFGFRPKFKLKLSGKPQVPLMELKAHFVDNPLMGELSARLTWRAELP